MKFFAVFFFAAFLAIASASAFSIEASDESVEDKSPIDAIQTLACVKKALDNLNQNIAVLTGMIGNFKDVLASNNEQMDHCNSIGGGHGFFGSVIDAIKKGDCYLHLADQLIKDLEGFLMEVQSAVYGILHAKGELESCFE